MAILAMTPLSEDYLALSRALKNSPWRLKLVASCEDAQDSMAHYAIEMLICASVLPDAGWKCLLREAARLPVPPLLVVLSDDGSPTEREVLDCGGYGVLQRPLQRAAILRVLRRGWLSWNSSLKRSPRKRSAA